MSSEDLKTGMAEINGARIKYQISGKGQPIVLVHAGICDSRMWDEQVPAFSKHYRVIRYDMRGYGESSMPAADFSHPSDLHGLLLDLAIEKAVLIGCSMGGRVIVDLALEHPEMVSGLILVAASVSGYDFEAEAPPQWQEMVAAFKSGDFDRAAELDCQIWLDGRQRTPAEVDSQVRQKVIEMDKIALENESQGVGQEIRHPKAAPRLAEIQVPTLILVGELDQPDLIQIARAMHTDIQDSQIMLMKGVAHLPNMEKPDEFNQLVLEFLRRRLG
jgi:3-oxoadipate enol-lactonase